MKRLIRIFVLLLLFALLLAPTLAEGEIFHVTAKQANIRTGPGIEYPVIGAVYQYYAFPIVAYSPTGNWVKLDFGGTQGWVFRHLGEIRNTGNIPVSTTATPTPSPTPTSVNNSGLIMGAVDSNYINSTVGVTASLNIRSGPGLGYRILTIVPYGRRAKPLARTANATWILIDYNGTTGWVYFLFVSFPPNLKVVNLPVQ